MRRKRRAARPVNFDWGRIAQQCPQFLQRFYSNAIQCIIFGDLGHKVLQCLDGVIDPESGKGFNHYFFSG